MLLSVFGASSCVDAGDGAQGFVAVGQIAARSEAEALSKGVACIVA